MRARRVFCLLLAAGCGPASAVIDAAPDAGGDVASEAPPADRLPDGPCTPGARRCDGRSSLICEPGNAWRLAEVCPAICDPARGCVDCTAGAPHCVADEVFACDGEGRRGERLEDCVASGRVCSLGRCVDPCAEAATDRSYLGCEYWPTVTTNMLFHPQMFHFAVAVANPGRAPAEVVVDRAGVEVARVTVAPGRLETVMLPWVNELLRAGSGLGLQSLLLRGGAYHLVSSRPVSAYQFNALEYGVTPDCPFPDTDGPNGRCHSYTNDASLLLPTSALSGNYRVASRSTLVITHGEDPPGSIPGFVAVVATQDGTVVSIDDRTEIAAGVPPGPWELDRGDVLQLLSAMPEGCHGRSRREFYGGEEQVYCEQGPRYDLTGARISANHPVAVFGGHQCTFVPFDKWACDHLEEQMIPVEAWEKRFVAARAAATPEPNIWRVLAHREFTQVTFTPPVAPTQTLVGGEWMELVTGEDFEIDATEPVLVVQYMVGQNYTVPDPHAGAPGDPAMSLVAPVAQYRKGYTFLAPGSYEQNYVNVIAPPDTDVFLDGEAVTGFAPVASGAFVVAKLPIGGEAHSITSERPFGIASYGVGAYTSYMYPGGLNVEFLTVP